MTKVFLHSTAGRCPIENIVLSNTGIKMGKSMKIAIAGIQEETQNYRNVLENLGVEGICTLNLQTTEEFGGLLLPGGNDIDPSIYGKENMGSQDCKKEFDLAQMDMVRRFLELQKPIFGICKGAQLLNVFFGGTLIQDLATNITHKKVGNADSIHMTTAKEGSFIYQIYGENFATNSAHHQAVDALGENLQIVQRAQDGVVEAFQHHSLPVWGVQWHPERMCFQHARSDVADGSKVISFFLNQCQEAKYSKIH